MRTGRRTDRIKRWLAGFGGQGEGRGLASDEQMSEG